MPRSGPRAVRKYSDEFKLTAVRLSQQPGLQVKTVATALEIHPFMLSKWRKDARDGRLRGPAPNAPPPGPAREIAQLQALEKAHALLHEEHELQKKGFGSVPLAVSRHRQGSILTADPRVVADAPAHVGRHLRGARAGRATAATRWRHLSQRSRVGIRGSILLRMRTAVWHAPEREH